MDAFDRCTELCFPLMREGGVEGGLVVACGDDAFLVLVACYTLVGVVRAWEGCNRGTPQNVSQNHLIKLGCRCAP